MRKIFVIVAFLLSFGTLSVQAQQGYYAGFQGGAAFLDSHFLKARHCRFDMGYNVGVVCGYAEYEGWRLESEIAYRYNRYRLKGTNEHARKTPYHGNVDIWSAMLNGYYDIFFWNCLTSYLGAGIGADYVHQSILVLGEKFKGSHKGFAWQVMGGVNYLWLEDLSLAAEYKFHTAPIRHGHHLQYQSVTFGINKYFSL